MRDLAGYVFSALRDGELALYRGVGAGLDPILLVEPVAEDSAGESLKRLEHEYSLRDALDPDWAARPMALARRGGHTTLVLEDPGGDPLDRLLGQPMRVPQFLRLAISLGVALGRVHERGLIHKDIKPANVLVDMATDGAWLTGFGIASRVPREYRVPEPPEVIAGTLAYMAPEQTGRMNRSVDSRSDLYALGVTLYELLTGVLPFTGSDPMEWIHCHIARRPVPPDERVAGIPEPLAAIVMKLLAKTAEDRYQTAAGLTIDLRRCLAEWEATGRIEPFQLGGQDASDRLLIPEKLYGREREIDILLAAFGRVVAHGTTELVLVSGYSGIGKSSVVNELHKVLLPAGGLFASGKLDQYKRDIPYATLAQAFKSLVRPLLAQSELELDRWRNALREALGLNGQLIVNLVPELELVIGKQLPVPELPPQDAQSRFQTVFRRFLGVFARPEHPLALFLDDLQWLDTATLDLLEHLVTHPEVRHLLLVWAYRDNEVGSAHPLMRTIETIREADGPIHEIVMTPLELDDVYQLVGDALQCEPGRAYPLAQLVQERTGGNPFFAIQFFTALAEEAMLTFDPVGPAWRWDIDRIRAKSYTDNVVDLMAGKLQRLSATTQEALKQLACLGNVAKISTLTMVDGETEETVHGALWEAVHAGLIYQQDGSYGFLHDRIQQAAYSLIPEAHRAEVHLRIGRVLLASMTTDDLDEHLFDVANHLNWGSALLLDQDEKAQVASIGLRAGRRAKASAAYASACVHLAAGMALLDETDWAGHYELVFGLRLERAECEFLTGNFDVAEQLIGELLQHGASKVDQAAAYRIKVLLHIVKSEIPQAVASALTCLDLFGINIQAHPTWDQVQAEYEAVWRNLNGRRIEDLIELPLMTDPELRAAMRLFSVLNDAAFFTDFHLFSLLLCRLVTVSMQHGMSGAGARGCAGFGHLLGPVFHRYREGYRFVKLACDLVEKHGFMADKANVHVSMGLTAAWTQPIGSVIDFSRAAFRAATETGDLSTACYSLTQVVTGLLVRNDPLDVVWRESEIGLDFARKARFDYVTDNIVNQQRFIAAMQGRTLAFSTFSDGQFDEAAFEAGLTGDRVSTMVCWYWILKLKARFLSGDYAEALVAAGKAEALLSASAARIQLLDYVYYTALTVAALYENASADERKGWRERLRAHREQLKEWAESYSPTFGDKEALVSAEVARLEGRDGDAMRLYEEAIQSARDHGFVQNEGVAHERAAAFHFARGSTVAGRAYLDEARGCFARWGAHAKVRQLEQLHPQLREDRTRPAVGMFGAAVAQLDIGAVVAGSQAMSSEIVLGRLIETLMTIAVEHAGASRGLLILLRGETPTIEAEARTDRDTVEVTLRQKAVTPTELPGSVLQTVLRTHESVILDDASTQDPFSADSYIRQRHARSVLCLPLMKQAKLVGVLYLENNLASRVFTPARMSVLRLLSSQAAISLENARLYAELIHENRDRQRAEEALRESEQRFRDYAETASDWLWETGPDHRFARLSDPIALGIDPASRIGMTRWDVATDTEEEPEKWRLHRAILEAPQPFRDFRYRTASADGSIVYIATSGKPVFDVDGHFLGYRGVSSDVTAAVRADQAEEALNRARVELAHVTRVTTLGELAASIAHEINQPLAAIGADANACLHWLAAAGPDLDSVRGALTAIAQDSYRAGEVIARIRTLLARASVAYGPCDLAGVIGEVLPLVEPELGRHGIVMRTSVAPDLPAVVGDRIQLQQVLLNLVLNAAEAMRDVQPSRRRMAVRATVYEGDDGRWAIVAVEDAGIGFENAEASRLFEAFYTTKPGGLGMGLSISRSIIDSHRGRLWATANPDHGVTFHLALPGMR